MTDADMLRPTLDAGKEWTRVMARAAFGWSDRRFRKAIADLREGGYPVVSTSDAGSVYRRARTREEVEDFIERELITRTRQLEHQIRALRDGADRYFGSDQLRLAV